MESLKEKDIATPQGKGFILNVSTSLVDYGTMARFNVRGSHADR